MIVYPVVNPKATLFRYSVTAEPIDTDKDGNQITIADIFSDPVNIADEVDLLINFKKLYTFINESLDEREKQIISKRYGLNTGNGDAIKAMTQREVAAHLKISRSYVSRIEKRALQKLKERFDGKKA